MTREFLDDRCLVRGGKADAQAGFAPWHGGIADGWHEEPGLLEFRGCGEGGIVGAEHNWHDRGRAGRKQRDVFPELLTKDFATLRADQRE